LPPSVPRSTTLMGRPSTERPISQLRSTGPGGSVRTAGALAVAPSVTAVVSAAEAEVGGIVVVATVVTGTVVVTAVVVVTPVVVAAVATAPVVAGSARWPRAHAANNRSATAARVPLATPATLTPGRGDGFAPLACISVTSAGCGPP